MDTSGYLILVHYSGKFIEFKGERLISIKEESTLVNEEYHAIVSSESARVDIEKLFSTQQTYLRSSTGAVSRHWSSEMDIILPFLSISEMSAKNSKFCLMWNPNSFNSRHYVIEFKNFHDQIIEKFETDRTSFNIDLSHYDYNPNLFLITVYDQDDREYATNEIGIKLGDQYSYTPCKCEIESALDALEMGFYLDAYSYSPMARKYFQLAVALSDHPIYEEFLTRYRYRWAIKD